MPQRFVTCQGPQNEIAVLVSELSKRVDLSGVLEENHIANAVMLESVRKWLGQFMTPEIDHLLKANITLYPIKRDLRYSPYHEDEIFPENDWILLFDFSIIDYYTFVITRQIERYESLYPGLGQFLLRTIDRTPFGLATPSGILNFIRTFFWGDMKNENEYAEEYLGIDKDNIEELNYVIDSLPVRYKQLTDNFPKWALHPRKSYKGFIPPEVAKIVEIADRNYPAEHMIYPYSNLPSILIWDDTGDYWEKSFIQSETEAMEASCDIHFGGMYWPLPLNNPRKLHEVFTEIECFISGFYQLLQAIYQIKLKV